MGKKTIIILIAIFFLGLFFRFYNLDKRPFWEDEATYALISNYIFENFFSDNYIPILKSNLVIYPHSFFYLNALGQIIFGNNELGNRFFTALFGSLTVLLIYFLGKELFNERVGFFAANILAFSPEHIAFSRENLPFIVPLFFFLLALYFLIKYLKEGSKKLTKNFYLALVFTLVSFSFHFLISSILIILFPITSKLLKGYIEPNIKFLLLISILVLSLYLIRIYYYDIGHDFYKIKNYIERMKLHEVFYPTMIQIYENYLDFKYLLIPLVLVIFLFYPFRIPKIYKKSIIIILILFVLTLILSLAVSSFLVPRYSFGYRTHIFFSYIFYLLFGLSLFVLYKESKKIAFLLILILLMLYSFHILPLLTKKVLSIDKQLNKIYLVDTVSIVCSKSYYTPLTLNKFINAFVFCYPHHPVYYNDAVNWKETVKIIKNQTIGNKTLVIFSSYAPIVKFYIDRENFLINKENLIIKDLHCNHITDLCSKELRFDVIKELEKYEKIKEIFFNVEIWFILDNDRYNWQLSDFEKDFIRKKCEKIEEEYIIIFKC